MLHLRGITTSAKRTTSRVQCYGRRYMKQHHTKSYSTPLTTFAQADYAFNLRWRAKPRPTAAAIVTPHAMYFFSCRSVLPLDLTPSSADADEAGAADAAGAGGVVAGALPIAVFD